MDIKLIEELERSDTSEETQELIHRWREIVKPGEYRLSGGRWKRYHPPKYQRNELVIIERKLWYKINKCSRTFNITGLSTISRWIYKQNKHGCGGRSTDPLQSGQHGARKQRRRHTIGNGSSRYRLVKTSWVQINPIHKDGTCSQYRG